jgi:hypothetical protein
MNNTNSARIRRSARRMRQSLLRTLALLSLKRVFATEVTGNGL